MRSGYESVSQSRTRAPPLQKNRVRQGRSQPLVACGRTIADKQLFFHPYLAGFSDSIATASPTGTSSTLTRLCSVSSSVQQLPASTLSPSRETVRLSSLTCTGGKRDTFNPRALAGGHQATITGYQATVRLPSNYNWLPSISLTPRFKQSTLFAITVTCYSFFFPYCILHVYMYVYNLWPWKSSLLAEWSLI